MDRRGSFVEYDPLTGLEYWAEDHADGKFSFHTYQDVEPIIDHCKAMANEGRAEKGFHGEGWHYALIPAIVQMEMLKKGIRILNPNDAKKVVDEINTNYPYLKTTHRHHALKR